MKQNQKGFTLVELAVVMVIIGLLIGGLLKGQQILENSRVSATVTQIGTIDTAAKAFYDTYTGYPGDLLNAYDRVPNISNTMYGSIPAAPAAPAVPCTGGDGAGNSMIGSCTWNMTSLQAPSGVGRETYLFWVELVHAGFLTGTTDALSSIASVSDGDFGTTYPEAKVGGGFVVGHRGSSGSGTTLTGLDNGPVLALIGKPTTWSAGITPAVAVQLDRKLDDGLADGGSVRSFGTASYCAPYVENDVKHKECGIYIRILKQ